QAGPGSHDSAAMTRRLRRLLLGLHGLGGVVLVLWAGVAIPPLPVDVHDISDPAKRPNEINSPPTPLAAGQAEGGQGRTHATAASAHPGGRAAAGKRGARALRLLRRTRQP